MKGSSAGNITQVGDIWPFEASGPQITTVRASGCTRTEITRAAPARALQLDLQGGGPSLLDAGMGQVGAVMEPGPDREQLVAGQGGVIGVEEPVVGVSAGAEVPVAQVLGVHGDEGTRPQAGAGHQVGDEEVEAAVEQSLAEVDGEPHALQLLARPPAEGPAQVAAQQPQRREGPAVAPGGVEGGAGLGVGAHENPAGGQLPRLAVRVPLTDRH
jgi:hypothetical protein